MLYLLIVGMRMQLQIGHANRERDMATIQLPGDVQAGVWLNSHTAENAVIMAMHVPIVYHYSQRNTVWFPPSRNPQMLMDGILRYKINFVIVVARNNSYYLPPDEESFDSLHKSYPDKLRLVHQTPQFKIFQVIASTAQVP